MRTVKWMLIVLILPVLFACLADGAAAQQEAQQQDSLAAAARRARAQKKDKPKAAKVWSNDDLESLKASPINVVGRAQATPSEDNSSNSQPNAQENAGASAAKPDGSKDQAALDTAKENLQSLQSDLDILQRQYSLDLQSFSQNPDHASDTAGQAKLNDEHDQLDAKQQEVSDAEKKVEELEAKVESAPAPAPENAPQQ